MISIESLLAAPLFLAPQLVGERLFFISNLDGHLSLYAMDEGGQPICLLPQDVALQNPRLIEDNAFYVFPALGKILLMIDQDGDENYQPMLIPLEGGTPEPAFGAALIHDRVACEVCDARQSLIYITAESRSEAMCVCYQGNLQTGTLRRLAASPYLNVDAVDQQHTRALLIDSYTMGDHVLYLWQQGRDEPALLYGTPLEMRQPEQQIAPNAIGACSFTQQGLLFRTALFSDTYGLGYMDLAAPQAILPVGITGIRHSGSGECSGLKHLDGTRYAVEYNIDGCSWLYEGTFEEEARQMHLQKVICGAGPLANGVLGGVHYDRASNRFALSFSTAVAPTQIYTVEGADRSAVVLHTPQQAFDVPADMLAPGEDASFRSFDGLRISARLYLPAAALPFAGPRPLVYYIHGGPQSQERPDFAWFSMALIQFLTFNGFAVFVPNVRGSSGYGLAYMKQVDRDWGGKDRRDHVQAMQVLAQDSRIDTGRAAVMGRSYGGYMTLMLAAHHPELWQAAVDMFGPYDLLTFMERIPETWKPYMALAVGDPTHERDFLIERSPRSAIERIACPMLIIQGKNDPRVVEQESRDLVEYLRSRGRQVDYLLFENEGHDVLKFENRVRCYTAITEFFKQHLRP